MKISKRLPLLTLAFVVSLTSVALPARAVTIANLVDTPTTLSFDFSGEGLVDAVDSTPEIASVVSKN